MSNPIEETAELFSLRYQFSRLRFRDPGSYLTLRRREWHISWAIYSAE